MRRRVKLSVMCVMVGSLLAIEPSVGRARTQKPTTGERVGEDSAQHLLNLEMEMVTLRQQIEGNRQAIDTLRAQFEERQATVEALTARLNERRGEEETLARQLDQVRNHAQRQQYFLYGVLGALGILGIALVGIGWRLRTHLSVQDREEIRQEIRTTLRGHLIALQNQRERDVAAHQKVEEALERVRQDILILETRVATKEAADKGTAQ
jgi:hypothetical protein